MNDKQVKEFINSKCIATDFPAPGVKFVDIFPLLNEFKHNIIAPYIGVPEKFILVPEARGFLFYFAFPLESSVFPLRKPGKLPGKTVKIPFKKEYGEDCFEFPVSYLDAMVEDTDSDTVEICFFDDVLATGGTAKAVCDFFESLTYGGKKWKVTFCRFFIELESLAGRELLEKYTFVQTLYKY